MGFSGHLLKGGQAAALLVGLVSSIGYAQEVCGIDSIFADGFEAAPATYPPLASLPGVIQSPGAAVSIIGPGTFSVSIASPANGAVIASTATEVTGTYTGPTDTGIVVNGHVASVDGGNFYVANLNLQPGSNTLNVTATKLTGETATSSISVTQTSSAVPVLLNLGRVASYAPFRVHFYPVIGTFPGGATVQSVAIDYNGDNVDDVTNPAPGADLNYLAQQPGLYRARLTVKDSNNVTYIAYHNYLVEDFPRQSGMLCDVYGYMRTKLSAASPDINGALVAVHPTEQSKFQSIWTTFGSALPAFATNLGVIATGTLDGIFGNFLVVRQNPDNSLSGFRMEFLQDDSGVWRISDM